MSAHYSADQKVNDIMPVYPSTHRSHQTKDEVRKNYLLPVSLDSLTNDAAVLLHIDILNKRISHSKISRR